MEGYSMLQNWKTQYYKNFPQTDLQRQCNPNQNPSSLSICENWLANSKMYIDIKRIKKNQDNL